MRLRRYPILPHDYEAVLRGSKSVLVLHDDGIMVGDEIVLEKTLGNQFQGGTFAVKVMHVEHVHELAGKCLASIKPIAEARRVWEQR